ncbi:hypothetical protein [Legionella sp. W05-934-2]|jgi:hypothetical protein|uniref:hypothetical protein n=1 Tax=Legionella sp. W05-934-2 TaxID=1198649 RepID=UPI00346380CB
MPGFFSDIRDSVGKPTSSLYLQAQRINAFAELATDTLSDFNPNVLIPGKIAQLALSVRSLFSKETHLHEKLMHAGQASINALQIGLSMYLFLSGNETCDSMENMMCRIIAGSQLIYRGLLLTGWVSSEAMAPSMPGPHPKAS